MIEFREALYESELASYVRDEGKSEWRGAGVGRVQQCGRFPARGPLFAASATVLYSTCRIIVSGRSLPGLYHVLQQDMLVVLPFSLLFRSTQRGEG